MLDSVEPWQIAVAATMLFVGSCVQGIVGFASGLLVTPVLVLARWSLPEAIAINLVAGIAQNISGCVRLRHAVEYKAWLKPNLLRLGALPVGVFSLAGLDSLDPTVIRQTVGAIIVGLAVLFWLWRVKPRDHIHRGWEVLAMTTSGFFAGFCGMGGPQMVFWLTAQTWPPERARAFLYYAFTLSTIPLAILLLYEFGDRVTHALLWGVVFLPAAWLGIQVGLNLGGKLPREQLRQAMLGVIGVVGVAAIVVPWLTT